MANLKTLGILSGVVHGMQNIKNINQAREKLKREKETHDINYKINKLKLQAAQYELDPEIVRGKTGLLNEENKAKKAYYQLYNTQIDQALSEQKKAVQADLTKLDVVADFGPLSDQPWVARLPGELPPGELPPVDATLFDLRPEGLQILRREGSGHHHGLRRVRPLLGARDTALLVERLGDEEQASVGEDERTGGDGLDWAEHESCPPDDGGGITVRG